MSSCSNCGQKTNGDEAFCPNCGAKMESVATAPTAPDNLPQLAPVAAPPLPPTTKRDVLLEYKAIPFKADLVAGEGTSKAADQLADLLNTYSRQGWRYLRVETLRTRITTPANKGCFGLGATPATVQHADVYVVVFARP